MDSIDYLLYIPIGLLICKTLVCKDNDFYKLARGIILCGLFFYFYRHFYQQNTISKLPINNRKLKRMFLSTAPQIDSNYVSYKNITTLINKFNYWYQLAMNSCGENSVQIDQYYQNALLYYQETMNSCNALLMSATSNSSNYDKVTTLITNLKTEMSTDLNKLKNLIVNNNICYTINRPANVGEAEPNDTDDFLYEKHYSLF